MKRLSGFITGVIITVLLMALFVPSFAASLQTIEVGTNSVNISIDGKVVTKIGESYVREGTESEICSSISWQGTTFVPIRRVSEILGIDVDYDSKTKTVMLTSNNYNLGKDTDTKMHTDTKTPNVQEVTITEEMRKEWDNKEKLSYEEFKSLWNLTISYTDKDGTVLYQALYNGELSKYECQYTFHNQTEPYLTYICQMIDDISNETDNNKVNIDFVYNENGSMQGLRWYSYKNK